MIIASLPCDLTSLIQRFGRAARGPGLQGTAILLAPPITHDKYNSRADVLEFVKAMGEDKERTCRWKVVDRYLGNPIRTRSNCCDVCLGGPSRLKANLPVLTGPDVVIPRKNSSDREQEVGRKRLLEWKKMAWDRYSKESKGQVLLVDIERSYLPVDMIEKFCQKLSSASTFEMVEAIAKHNNWIPMESSNLEEIAQVIKDALFDIHNSTDQTENYSRGLGEGVIGGD